MSSLRTQVSTRDRDRMFAVAALHAAGPVSEVRRERERAHRGDGG